MEVRADENWSQEMKCLVCFSRFWAFSSAAETDRADNRGETLPFHLHRTTTSPTTVLNWRCINKAGWLLEAIPT